MAALLRQHCSWNAPCESSVKRTGQAVAPPLMSSKADSNCSWLHFSYSVELILQTVARHPEVPTHVPGRHWGVNEGMAEFSMRPPQNHIMCLRMLFKCFLNSVSLGAVTLPCRDCSSAWPILFWSVWLFWGLAQKPRLSPSAADAARGVAIYYRSAMTP